MWDDIEIRFEFEDTSDYLKNRFGQAAGSKDK